MSATVACLNCGSAPLVIACGQRSGSAARVPLQACQECGYVYRLQVDYETECLLFQSWAEDAAERHAQAEAA